jgi:flagellin-like hook-associated protein FlgL
MGIAREILEMRSQFDTLQLQLATGKKSQTYAGLGSDRLTVLSVRARVSAVDAFQKTIDQVQVRLDAVQLHLDRLRDVASQTRSETLVPEFQVINGTQTQAQLAASERLNETLALLNFEIGGRHAFSGNSTEKQPVVSSAVLLDGLGGQAGLRQVIDERRQADTGADGLGRLAVTSASPTVSLAEDAAGHPFGFKIAAVSSTLSGTAVAGPAGAPASIDVTFSASLPQAGQKVEVSLDLPDGTQTTVTLTATATAPPGAGEFLIGADEATTAANFETALNSALVTAARTELASASAHQAANDFFYYDSANPPQRVDGPPFDSATAMLDATAADTVFWYKGDNGPGAARDTAIARIDDTQAVGYGTRANEEPLTTLVSSLALMAAETYSETDADDPARYKALSKRVAEDLNYVNKTSIDDMIVELGFKQKTLQVTAERHNSAQQISQTLLQQKEGVDDYEVGTKLLRLQTTLQASFEATSLMARLSLVNFL